MKPIEAMALVGGYVDEELLARNEYLAAENEILSKLVFFGEQSLWTALREYLAHDHPRTDGEIQRRERLGGLLKYYDREAA